MWLGERGGVAVRHLDRLRQDVPRRFDRRIELVAGQDLAARVGPVLAEDRLHLRRDGAGGAHHDVAPLVRVAGVAQPLVGDAEAAGEADPAVHHQDLAVRPAADLVEAPQPDGVEHVGLDPRLLQAVEQRAGPEAPGAVHQHPHLDPPPRGVDQRRGDDAARLVVLEDVGLEVDRLPGVADRLGERREDGVAVVEDLGAVPPHHGVAEGVERAAEGRVLHREGVVVAIGAPLVERDQGAARGEDEEGAERQETIAAPEKR
jgi:hypothetical protein